MVKSNILVFGALGEPSTSVIRLYLELLINLQDEYHIIAIDSNLEAVDLNSHSESLGLCFDLCFTNINDYTQHQNDMVIAAVLILTPLGSHYSILRELAEDTQFKNALVVLEKPSFSLDEVKSGFTALVPALNKKNVTVYFIDSAMVSPVFDCDRVRNVFDSYGLPKKVIALAMDNPLERYGEWGEYSFERRLSAINKRKLLSLPDSGGAGLGLDMGVHAIAGLMRLFHENNFTYNEIEIQNVELEAINCSALERDKGAESQVCMEAIIKGESGCIPLQFIAGKGGSIWDRRIELYYENLVMTISFGTLSFSPYIAIFENNELVVETFELRDSGYVQHHKDIRSLLSTNANNTLNVSPELSQKVMENTMLTMKSMYDFCSNDIDFRELLIQKVDVHSMLPQDNEQKSNSERINRYFNEI